MDETKKKAKKLLLVNSLKTPSEVRLLQHIDSVEEELKKSDAEMKTAFEEKLSNEIIEVKKAFPTFKEVLSSIEIPEPIQGDPGKDGNDYVLTEKDKAEIASKISVPTIEKHTETIIEKVEVIRETPIVTENIIEKAVADEPNIIAEKLNTLEEAIDQSVIKGLVKKISEISFNISHGVVKDNAQLYTGISETRALELIHKNGSGFTGVVTDSTLTGLGTVASPLHAVGDGIGDMLKATYDPTNKAQDIFSYTDTGLATKENSITAGTSAQYWRGDKTFQTLNTAAVPELTNLYFTNARAIASTLTGYTSGAGTVSATDTILQAIQKLNGNTAALVTGVSSVNSLTGSVALTGTSNRITISASNVFDISASYVGQSSITTLGTITTGVWNGTTIAIANGGTGQTTANAALNALLPSQTSNSGKFLTTDGSNTSWATVSGGGGITIGTTTITSGTNTRLLFDDSGVVGESANLTFDKTNQLLSIGKKIQVGDSSSVSTATPTELNMGGTYADSVTSSKAKWKLYDDGTPANIFGIGISLTHFNFFTSVTGEFYYYQNNSQIGKLGGSSLNLGNLTSTSTATPFCLDSGGTYADSVTSTKAKWKLYDDGTAINTYGIGISAGQFNFFKSSGGLFAWYFADVEAARFTGAAILKTGGTATRGTTEGTNHLDLFDGTAPAGTLTNGASIYSASGVPTVMDSSGNANGLGQTSKPTFAGTIFTAPARLKNYTVATLPAGTQGDIAYVTDALAPGFLTVIVGGGTVVAPVFYNGSNWIAM